MAVILLILTWTLTASWCDYGDDPLALDAVASPGGVRLLVDKLGSLFMSTHDSVVRLSYIGRAVATTSNMLRGAR